MENGLLYILAFSAMAIALFALVMPQLPDLPQGNYDYKITTDGTNYSAIQGDGTIAATSTNCSYIANYVSTALRDTGGLITFGVGTFDFDRPLLVSEGQHYLGASKSYTGQYATSLRLKQWSNCSLITAYNLTAANNDISFEGMSFFGWGSAQSAGDLVYFQRVNFMLFRDVGFYEAYRDLLRFDTGTAQQVTIDNCWFQGSYTGSALRSLTMTDSVVMKSMFATQYYGSYQGSHAIYLTSTKVTFIGNIVTVSYEHGIYNAGAYNLFQNNIIHTNRKVGLYFEGAYECIASENLVYNNGQYGAANYPGIQVYNSYNNTINNNRCYDVQGTRTQLAGIFEWGTNNYNVYVGDVAWGNTNVQISTNSATAQVHSCFNGSTWIT